MQKVNTYRQVDKYTGRKQDYGEQKEQSQGCPQLLLSDGHLLGQT